MDIACLICMELLKEEEELHVTKCGHIFHCDCLRKWLLRSKTCPQCRYKVKEGNLIPLFPSIRDETSREVMLQLEIEYVVLRIQEIKELYENFSKVKRIFASLMCFSLGINLMLGLLNYFKC